MKFEAITEKLHRRDKAEYISNDVDISEKEFSLPMPPTSKILNQGATSPTCISHAIVMAVMVAIRMQTGKWAKPSPHSMHAYFDTKGGGGTVWYYAELLCRWGILPTRLFPHRGDNPELHDALVTLAAETPNLEEIANHLKGCAWAELDSFDDVKHALKAGYPVIGSLRVGNSFGKNGGVEPVYPKNTDAYHAVEFNGWCVKDGKECLVAINSHGKNSGDSGKVYIPRGRLLKELTLIDFSSDHIKRKAKCIEFFIGANHYKVDGEFKEFEVSPYIKADRTYLPVRFVAKNLGATVEWDAETGSAHISSEEAFITISTKSNVIIIDGKKKYMDVMPDIVNGRMMCPIRHIAEALNCKVEWSASESKAVITAL